MEFMFEKCLAVCRNDEGVSATSADGVRTGGVLRLISG